MNKRGCGPVRSASILGLLLACCAWSAGVNAAQRAAAPDSCDRECLRGAVTQLLHALVKHDVSGVPVADTVRVTEDAVDKPLGKVGLVTTVTRLRGFRQDIIDERAGVAAAQVVVEETRRRSVDGVGGVQGLRRPDPRRGSVHANSAGRETQRRMAVINVPVRPALCG